MKNQEKNHAECKVCLSNLRTAARTTEIRFYCKFIFKNSRAFSKLFEHKCSDNVLHALGVFTGVTQARFNRFAYRCCATAWQLHL